PLCSLSFFQAEDGIRDRNVTGVQTCALPISDVQRREDFVGAFTHELKTPMTSILGYADVLRTLQTDPEEQREAANAIYQESRRQIGRASCRETAQRSAADGGPEATSD